MDKVQIDAWRWMSDMDGQWLCLRTDKAREACEGMEDGKAYEVSIAQQKRKRSLDANGYFWCLLDKLAERLEFPKIELYRDYIKNIGGNCEIVCVLEKAADRLIDGWTRNGMGWVAERFPSKLDNCVNVCLYYGSSVYDTAQMSRLIDLVVQDCKIQGIETLTEKELSLLKERWV